MLATRLASVAPLVGPLTRPSGTLSPWGRGGETAEPSLEAWRQRYVVALAPSGRGMG
jgi:hypothetical protein